MDRCHLFALSLSNCFSPSLNAPCPRASQELYRQRGLRQLIRRTTASSWLGMVPGVGGGVPELAIISMCGSALQSDWEELGPPIETAVASFVLGSAAAPVAAAAVSAP
jgi:hypothetical protein